MSLPSHLDEAVRLLADFLHKHPHWPDTERLEERPKFRSAVAELLENLEKVRQQ